MRALLLVLLLAAPALAGCASDDAPADDTTPPTGGTPAMNQTAPPEPVVLEVRTTGAYPVNPGFSPGSLEAASGTQVVVKLTNAETAPLVSHDWVLEGVDGAATESLSPGQTGEVTFTAPAPGAYAYFCSIGDHRAKGMEGTLTVK